MPIKLTATIKGFITGMAMIAVALLFVAMGKQPVGLPQYIIYAVYTAGIVWTLLDYRKNGDAVQTFKAHFNEGFKCFIVVTLLMVAYTYTFFTVNTSYRDAMANIMRQELTKQGNATPAEIDGHIAVMKRNFTLLYTAGSVFFYLFIGALVTLVASAFFTRNKN
jgi:hypothetical protein